MPDYKGNISQVYNLLKSKGATNRSASQFENDMTNNAQERLRVYGQLKKLGVNGMGEGYSYFAKMISPNTSYSTKPKPKQSTTAKQASSVGAANFGGASALEKAQAQMQNLQQSNQGYKPLEGAPSTSKQSFDVLRNKNIDSAYMNSKVLNNKSAWDANGMHRATKNTDDGSVAAINKQFSAPTNLSEGVAAAKKSAQASVSGRVENPKQTAPVHYDTTDKQVHYDDAFKEMQNQSDLNNKKVEELSRNEAKDVVSSAMADADKEFADIIKGQTDNQGGLSDIFNYDDQTTQTYKANAEVNPNEVLDKLQKNVAKNYLEMVQGNLDRYKAAAANEGKSVLDYIQQNVLPAFQKQIKEEFDNSQIARYMPKNTGDALANGVYKSIIGGAARLGTMTLEQRQYQDQAVQQYNDAWAEKNKQHFTPVKSDGSILGDIKEWAVNQANNAYASGLQTGQMAVGMAVDAPLLKLQGAAAESFLGKIGMGSFIKAVGKDAAQTTSRFLEANAGYLGNAIINAARMGTTLSQYGATNAVVTELSNGNTNLASIGVSAAHAFRTDLINGTIMGGTGGIMGKLGRGIGIKAGDSTMKAMAHGAEKTLFNMVGLVSEGFSMHLGEQTNSFFEGNGFNLTWKGTLEGAVTAGALKLTSGSNYKDFKAKARKFFMAENSLSDAEWEDIYKATDSHSKEEVMSKIFVDGWKSTGNAPEEVINKATTNYLNMMNRLAWDTQQKITAGTTNVASATRPRTDSFSYEGNTIKELDDKGNVLSVKKFSTKDEAQAYLTQKKLNTENNDFFGTYGKAILRDTSKNHDYVNGIIIQTAEESGAKATDIVKAMMKVPIRRTEQERALLVNLEKNLHDYAYPKDELHTDQSVIDGKNVAEQSDVTGEHPNTEAVQNLSNEVDQAVAEFNEAVGVDGKPGTAEWADAYDPKKSPADNYVGLIGKFNESGLTPIIHYLNALAKQQGFMDGVRNKIKEKANYMTNLLTSSKITIDSQERDKNQIITLIDPEGNAHLMVAGDMRTVKGRDTLENDQPIIVVDKENGECTAVDRLDGWKIANMDVKADAYRAELESIYGENATEVIDPEGKLTGAQEQTQGSATEETKEQTPKEDANVANGAEEERTQNGGTTEEHKDGEVVVTGRKRDDKNGYTTVELGSYAKTKSGDVKKFNFGGLKVSVDDIDFSNEDPEFAENVANAKDVTLMNITFADDGRVVGDVRIDGIDYHVHLKEDGPSKLSDIRDENWQAPRNPTGEEILARKEAQKNAETAEGTTATTEGDGNNSEDATLSKEETKAEEEKVPTNANGIPLDEDGEPNYMADGVKPVHAVNDIYNDGTFTKQQADKFVDNNLKVAKKAYDKVNKEIEPKEGEGKNHFAQRKAEHEAEVNAAKATLDKWQAIYDEAHKWDVPEIKGEELGNADVDTNGIKETKEYIIAQYVGKVLPEEYKKEVGLGKEGSHLIASKEKGGVTVDDIVLHVREDYPQFDEGDVRNIVIDVLRMGGKTKYTKSLTEKVKAEKEHGNFDLENARDNKYIEQYDMPYNDYLDYQQQLYEKIASEYRGVDEQTVAEEVNRAYEELAPQYEAMETERDEQIHKENEQLLNELNNGREDTRTDRGDQLLQEEQSTGEGGLRQGTDTTREGEASDNVQDTNGEIQGGTSTESAEAAEPVGAGEQRADSSAEGTQDLRGTRPQEVEGKVEETSESVEKHPAESAEEKVDTTNAEQKADVSKITDEEAKGLTPEERTTLQSKLDKVKNNAKSYILAHMEKSLSAWEKSLPLQNTPLGKLTAAKHIAILKEAIEARNAYAKEHGIKNGNMTIDETIDLFNHFNSDGAIGKLAEKVFAVAKLFNPKIKMTRQLTTGADGNSGDDGIVKYNFGRFATESLDSQYKANTIVHELIHNATQSALNAYKEHKAGKNGAWDKLTEGQQNAVRDLCNIYDKIKNSSEFANAKEKNGRDYGVTDVYEMVAEMSTPEFREHLKAKNLWTKFKNSIKQFFGIETLGADKTTAFAEIDKALDYLLENPNKEVYNLYKSKNGRSRSPISEAFDNELDEFKANIHKGILHLGKPMEILKACGVNAKELTISPSVLYKHLNKHGLTTDDLKGLADAIQRPIFVYKHGRTVPNIVVVTELDVKGGKLSVAVKLDKNGNVVEVSNISSVHSKDAITELERLSLLDKDTLKDSIRWVDKEKVSDWLLPSSYEKAGTTTDPKLIDVAKIIKDFDNPTINKESLTESRNKFIGERGASKEERDALDIAEQMEMGGKDELSIKAATGWERGADGKWRYEQPDGDFKKDWDGKDGKLSDIWDDDALFKAYPDLKDCNVRIYDKKEKTIGGSNGKTIILNKQGSDMSSTMIHEIQHLIQQREGFAGGGSPGMLHPEAKGARLIVDTIRQDIDKTFDELMDLSNKHVEIFTDSKLSPEEIDKLDAEYNTKEEKLRADIEAKRAKMFKVVSDNNLGLEGYKRLAGEVEARNVEARRKLTEAQRRQMLASETEDVERPQQIIVGAGRPSLKIGSKRKADMDSQLAKKRPDMSETQRKETIAEIEKLGERVKEGGDPKTEKLAQHWVVKGNLILPEDEYKLRDAMEVAQKKGIDPFSYDNPTQLLMDNSDVKPSVKPTNPDTVKVFSNKQELPNGVTVYDVENSKEGQKAVREIIDTHWGKDANPWCLAARTGDGDNLDHAWDMWNHYDAKQKKIAFRDGKLLAFHATDDAGKTEWWDRVDKPYEGFDVTEKNADGTTSHRIMKEDGTLGETTRITKGNESDGAYDEWDANGVHTKHQEKKNGKFVGDVVELDTSMEDFPAFHIKRYNKDGKEDCQYVWDVEDDGSRSHGIRYDSNSDNRYAFNENNECDFLNGFVATHNGEAIGHKAFLDNNGHGIVDIGNGRGKVVRFRYNEDDMLSQVEITWHDGDEKFHVKIPADKLDKEFTDEMVNKFSQNEPAVKSLLTDYLDENRGFRDVRKVFDKETKDYRDVLDKYPETDWTKKNSYADKLAESGVIEESVKTIFADNPKNAEAAVEAIRKVKNGEKLTELESLILREAQYRSKNSNEGVVSEPFVNYEEESNKVLSPVLDVKEVTEKDAPKEQNLSSEGKARWELYTNDELNELRSMIHEAQKTYGGKIGDASAGAFNYKKEGSDDTIHSKADLGKQELIADYMVPQLKYYKEGLEKVGAKFTGKAKEVFDNAIADVDKAIKWYDEFGKGQHNKLGDHENDGIRFSEDLDADKQEQQTHSENFKNWFGDWENDPKNASKVVDKDGKPLIVYHGTQHMEMYIKDGHPYTRYTEPFTEFKDGKGFFTDDKEASQTFARGKQGLYACYLDMKNPFVFDCNGKDYDSIEGYENPDGYKYVSTDFIVNDIKRNHPEYDGVIFKNVGGENNGNVKHPIDDYVPFKAEQIKSATDNTGDFSKNNKDIRYSEGEGNTNHEEANVVKAHVEQVAKDSNAKINTHDSIDSIKDPVAKKAIQDGRNIKGWYDTKTGEVHLYLPNIHSRYEAEKTIVHENVAHKGLRQTLGEEGYKAYQRMVWEDKTNPVYDRLHKFVNDYAAKNGWDFYEAVDEFIAREAEDTVRKPDLTMWGKIKEAVVEGLRKMGYRWNPNINDVRYMLWLAKRGGKNPNDPLFKARAAALRDRLAKQDVSPKVKGGRYVADSAEAKIAELSGGEKAKLLWSAPLTPIGKAVKDEYDRQLNTKSFRYREAFHDSMESLRKLQELITGKGIYDVKDSENAYVSENHQTSIAETEWNKFKVQKFQPLEKAINACVGLFGGDPVKTLKEVEAYTMKKSGLERNRKLLIRDAIEGEKDEAAKSQLQSDWDAKRAQLSADLASKNIDYREYLNQIDDFIRTNIDDKYDPNKNDYSGISAYDENRTKNGKDVEYDETAIIDDVMDAEAMLGDKADNLWSTIKDATDYSVDYSYNTGMTDSATRDKIKGMFDFYIPMRGFAEGTMEDLYDYVGSREGMGEDVIKNAKGRTSLSESQFAHIASMATSAITMGERNLVKQKLYRMVANNKSDAATVSDVWEEKVIDGIDPVTGDPTYHWEQKLPNIPPDARPEQVANIIDQFEKDMATKQANGDARVLNDAAHFDRQFKNNFLASEHAVPLNINGKTKVVYVLGNPRAAQAINGRLNHKNNAVAPLKWLMNTTASLSTSYSPEFIVSNASRDTLFSNANIASKESAAYLAKFTKNQAIAAKLMGTTGIGGDKLNGESLFEKYYRGHINTADPTEKMFAEFMDNGGRTGFIAQRDIEQHFSDLKASIKGERVTDKTIQVAAEIGKSIPKMIEQMNMRAELINRFATYKTSREMGRSLLRSVADAKEVSVNFNRHGAGNATKGWMGSTAGFFRDYYMFFNAGMQSMELLYRNMSKDKSSAIRTVAYMGLVPAMVGTAVAAIFASQDDEKYSNIPSWDRRNNICIPCGESGYVKIPLPIELRAFWGMGDILASTKFSRLRTDEDPWFEMIGQITQALPLDVLEGGESKVTDVKSMITHNAPTALRPWLEIMNNESWTGKPIQKDNKFNEAAPQWTLAYSSTPKPFVEFCKFLHDKTRQGKETAQETDATGLNLSPAMMEHLLKSYFSGAYSLTGKVAGVATADEFEASHMPLVSRLWGGFTDKEADQTTNAKFWAYKKEADAVLKEYSNKENKANPLAIAELDNSARGKRAKLYKQIDKKLKKINKAQNKETDPQTLATLKRQEGELKRDLVDALDAIE